MEPLFRRGMVTSLSLIGDSVLSYALSLLWNRHSKVQLTKRSNNSYLSSPSGKAVVTNNRLLVSGP